MASNNYNPYNYPYQQSSAQQYSAYQTAPASNDLAQSSRQYQPTPATSQAADYMSYQGQSYGGQGNAYGGPQDNGWGGNSYGGNRETTSRAAEVLRNMSNTTYTSNNATAVSQPGFTATNAATASRYSSNTPQAQHSHHAPQSHTSSSSYGQPQSRPRSVNANRGQAATSRGLPSPAMVAGYPSQRASTVYNQQPQRPASPAQAQYTHNTQTPVSSARNAAMTAATHYNDYTNRQLPNLDATRKTNAAVSSSYSYADTQAPTPVVQAPTNNVTETYNQGTITVDPMAVYDPWPEYQRKQEALRAQKAAEDAARAEQERIAEEARQEEERKKDEERKKQEEEERVRMASISKSKQKSRKSQQPSAAEVGSSSSAGASTEAAFGDPMESEIRALMAKMREFNSKDPALLARIWEEERRSKIPKSPTASSKPASQATAQAAQPSAPQAGNQKKKAAAREIPAAAAKVVTPVPTPHMARPALPPTVASTRAGGNTIWPPEKKATLATAAATYLKIQNPQIPLQSDQILNMLDGNPSYIELCEQLENMGLKLDRAAFAKNLLTAVPDVNSTSRAKTAQGPSTGTVAARAPVAPPAIMKRDIGTPATPAANYAPAAPSPAYPAFPESANSAAPTPAPVAEMVPIKPELKRPANKEEAARKRDFNDLIDLTQVDDDDLEPPPKKTNIGSMYSYAPAGQNAHDYMDLDEGPSANFPIPARATPQPVVQQPDPPAARELRYTDIVEPLDRKKALRRNTYNIKTIARDVLLACGRHPETRQLNQHLEILRTTLPQIQQDADLSTLRWDLIDPGRPPPGYFRDSVQGLAEDADDEEDSDEEGSRQRPQSSSMYANESTSHPKVQAPLPEAINPFKQKRRGRPPRHSFPSNPTTPSTPTRPVSQNMSASAPRATSAGVGYSAFRSATQYDANGNPLPKKRGRPVGWRKNIHGSTESQTRPSANAHTGPLRWKPSQPSALRNENTGGNEPIRIDSRSPSVLNKARRFQSFKCKWQNCKAELHNLETLKQHVRKVHRNGNPRGFIECHWAECGKGVTSQDAMTGIRIERHEPMSFTTEAKWIQHLEQSHFDPVSWELGDGPASGISDTTDSEAYLSDAHGRRVTPTVTARPEYLDNSGMDTFDGSGAPKFSAPRGRGRPPKEQKEDVRRIQERLVAQKIRVGGPGMDRGGATLVNEKRRRGFSDDNDTEEELVDAED